MGYIITVTNKSTGQVNVYSGKSNFKSVSHFNEIVSNVEGKVGVKAVKTNWVLGNYRKQIGPVEVKLSNR